MPISNELRKHPPPRGSLSRGRVNRASTPPSYSAVMEQESPAAPPLAPPDPPAAPDAPPAPAPPFLETLKAELIALPIADLDQNEKRTAVWSIGISLAAFLTMAQPLLRFGDAVSLAAAGALAGTATLAFVSIYDYRGKLRYPLLVIAMAAGLAAIGIVLAGASSMRASAEANDRRCLALQRDMLAALPRKKDGAALFRALGCDPQGEGSVMVPATAAEYRRSHRILGVATPVDPPSG